MIIPYETNDEREAIIQEQKKMGYMLIEDHIGLTEKTLLFAPVDMRIVKNENIKRLLRHHDFLITQGLLTDAYVTDDVGNEVQFKVKTTDSDVSMWQLAQADAAILGYYPLIVDYDNNRYLNQPSATIDLIAYQLKGYRSNIWLRYHKLCMLVEAATTVDEVETITWDTEV